MGVFYSRCPVHTTPIDVVARVQTWIRRMRVMAGNFLEQLVAEWYEYQGYFVRRNVRVGKWTKGGYEGELDVVAFHPETKRLVHVESSMDADSWGKRKQRFTKKFEAGKKYIRPLTTLLAQSVKLQSRPGLSRNSAHA